MTLSDLVKTLVSELPGGGFVVALAESVDKVSRESKDVDEQLSQLSTWCDKWLEDVNSKIVTDARAATNAVDAENVKSVIDKVRETIKEFHDYVQAKQDERHPEKMGKRVKTKAWFQRLLAKDNEAIAQRILAFKQELQLSLYRLIIDSYDLTRKTHDSICRMEVIIEKTHAIVERLERKGEDVSESEISEIEVLMRMDMGDSNPNDRTKLKQLFSKKSANERLKLSLRLILLDDDDAKLMGLRYLKFLLQEDLNDFDIDGALIHLIDLARDVNEEVKKRASAILKTIAEKDELKAQFFKRVRVLSESEANKQAIAETIADLILDCARKIRNSKGRSAWNAFDALRMLVKTESCRHAIAEAGGIPALTEIYKGTAELIWSTEENPNSTKDTREWKTTNKQAIDALIKLAKNKESRSHFSSDTIWPLIHWMDKVCLQYHPLDSSHNDGKDPLDLEPPVGRVVPVGPSDQQRVRRAGEALWQLSLIDKFKSVINSLSKVLIVKSVNDIDFILENAPDKNGFDDLHSWSIWMRKMDSEKFECDKVCDGGYDYQSKGRNLSQVELFSTICTSFRNLLWSLVLDGETAVAVAACWYDTRPEKHRFHYMENVDPEYCEYWVKTVLHHIGLSEEMPSKNVSGCLKILMEKLDDGDASAEQKERAAKVLWFCSLAKTVDEETISSSFSTIEADVVERCDKLIQTGTPAQIFWATGILANLTWRKTSPKDVAVAVVKGAQRIVETESREFVFLARYVADRQPGFEVSVENEGLYFDSSFYDELHKPRE